MRISNSKLDCYQQCPKKYYFKYIQNLKGNYTASPLLYGTAMDAALNYILESIRDGEEYTLQAAQAIFIDEMSKWDGQNRLDFFKNEVPEELKVELDEDNLDHQEIIWEHILKRGLASIEVYINDVVPQLDEVISVQNKGTILNDDGDELVFVVDFIAKLKDGRTVLFDNKTASAKYPKNKVINSQQLSLYLEAFPDIKLAGYIVLIKNPEKEKGMTFQMLIDEIPDSTRDHSFALLEQTIGDIKEEKFPKNFKSCKAFGKTCEYSRLCIYGDPEGLIPAYEKKKDV